jgi:divalent metal cation (Fe/Co/Zn/Cd) transporter
MNRADWLTASAAIAGVVGIGFGLWWADSVAAIVISLDILHDGQRYLRGSTADLLDDAPRTHDEEEPHPLIGRVKQEVEASAWVADAVVRLRENGHVLAGTVWVVPEDDDELVERVEELTARLRDLDWQLNDVVVSPVRSIEGAPGGLRVSAEARDAKRGPGSVGIRARIARLLTRR